MKFSDIIGHDELKIRLAKGIDKGRIAHSQLFLGKSGYGTFALALAYAQYLSCSNKTDGDSCGICSSCRKISTLQHPDLHILFPVNKSSSSVGTSKSGDTISDNLIGSFREFVKTTTPQGYGTEQQWYESIQLSKNSQGIIGRPEAENIIRKLSFKSYENGYIIVIIWLANKMNESAANTLLKLLEEPGSQTLFILLAEDTKQILPTILSRTQTVYVRPTCKTDIEKYLISSGQNVELARSVSRICEGNVSYAIELCDEITKNGFDEDFNMFVSLMRLCFKVDHQGLLSWAEDLASLSRESQKHFLKFGIEMVRNSYFRSLGLNDLIYCTPSQSAFIEKFYPYIHHQNLEILVDEFEKCSYHISQNGNARVVITHFTLAISKLIRKIR